jgi:hypothetical protein
MFIRGFRTTTEKLATLRQQCTGCDRATVHQVLRRRTRFHLLLLPLSRGTADHHLRCTYCGDSGLVSKQRFDWLVRVAREHRVYDARRYVPWDAAPEVAAELCLN